MSIQLIEAKPIFDREPREFPCLHVSELFYNTIQGENFVGVPSAFLRLQGCTLNCTWCDTEEVWQQGNPYGIKELVEMILASKMADRLADGQNLVITGGSPLKQQYELILFLQELVHQLGFTPYIEIENECVIKPSAKITPFISCWNNSPKLSNSGNSTYARYKQSVIAETAKLDNSWFKFVVTCEKDVEEILTEFVRPKLIERSQIVLMPEGQTREQILKNAPIVAELCIKYNLRYTSREHIILWDKKTGV